MKRFILVLILFCATVSINAQNSRRSASQSPKGEEQANLQQWRGELQQVQGELQQVVNAMNNRLEELKQQETKSRVAVPTNATNGGSNLSEKINDIENQIESLKTEIHSIYLSYSKQPLFSDKKAQTEAFNRVEKEKKDLQTRIVRINDSITILEENHQWIERLREYYEKRSIDTLFVQSDLVSILVHKSIIGNIYPKVMDYIQTLLEGAELLTKEYDAKQNQKYVQSLKNVQQQCERKEYLIGLLQVHKDITDEVNNWMAKEEHTLYSMAVFQNYLINNYGVALDTDYPWLATKIRETVTSTLPKR